MAGSVSRYQSPPSLRWGYPITTNTAKIRQRNRDIVDGLIATHLQNYKGSGAELIMGSERSVAPRTLEVQLNGGYVGLELAQAYRRFGSRVTIVEHGLPLAGREGVDVATEIRGILIDAAVASCKSIGPI